MSDNELDEELLALAGDGSGSDNEDAKSEAKAPRSPSPVAAAPVSSTPASSAAAPATVAKSTNRSAVAKPQKGVAQRKTNKSARSTAVRSRKRTTLDADDQESSNAGSPDSLGSGAMSESESDAEPIPSLSHSVDDDGILFPIEGKFHSEQDRKDIMALPEIRREEILAERAYELERRTQDLQLRRLLQDRQREEAKAADKRKRNSALADLDDSPPKTSKKSKTSESLEAYKRSREQRGEQRKRDDDRRKRDKHLAGDDGSYLDVDADGESDVEWDDQQTIRPKAREEVAPVLRDFQHVCVGRSNFAKVCFWPGFEDAIRGCFCRVSIGVDRSTGQNTYRMTQIKRFTTGRPYAMEGSNGRTFMTDQYAIVAHGKAEKEWPFLACSDSKLTEAEFERYKRTLNDEMLRVPTLSYLHGKLKDINNLLSHRMTDEEIQEKLRRSGLLQNKFAPIERHRLTNEREKAASRGDEATVARLDQEIAALAGPKLAFGTSLHSGAKGSVTATSKAPSQQERLAALNRANRRANAEEVRKAQIAERRAEAKVQAAVARGEAQANPFARVKTRAKVHHDARDELLAPPDSDLFGDGSDRSRAATPLPATGFSTPGVNTPTKVKSLSRAGTPQPSSLRKEDKPAGLPGFRRKNMDDDVIAAMDLGIEIDIS